MHNFTGHTALSLRAGHDAGIVLRPLSILLNLSINIILLIGIIIINLIILIG